jgi:hypothetical protein
MPAHDLAVCVELAVGPALGGEFGSEVERSDLCVDAGCEGIGVWVRHHWLLWVGEEFGQ